MRYDGPIYRPPSEADSLLVQATAGCPHNLCTFCMVYKDGVKFKVRPVSEIKADLIDAAAAYGSRVRTLFFPAGNTIAMPARSAARQRNCVPRETGLRQTSNARWTSSLVQGVAYAPLPRTPTRMQSGRGPRHRHQCAGAVRPRSGPSGKPRAASRRSRRAESRRRRPAPPSGHFGSTIRYTTVVSPTLTTSCQATPGLVKLLPVARLTSRVPFASVIRMCPPLIA